MKRFYIFILSAFALLLLIIRGGFDTTNAMSGQTDYADRFDEMMLEPSARQEIGNGLIRVTTPNSLPTTPTDLPERTEDPGPFLSWPLPSSINLTNITRLPDTKWTHNLLGIIACPPYPALIDAGYWGFNGVGNAPGNRHLILPDVPDQQVKWQNADNGVPFNNAIACYSATSSIGLPDHAGTDISASNGTDVYAAASADQVVVLIDGAGDYRVMLRHSNVNNTGQTWYTFYVHMSASVYGTGTHNVDIPVGTKIGEVGRGHLHFQPAISPSYSNAVARNPWGIDVAPWTGCLWQESSICPILPEEPPAEPEEPVGIGHFPDVGLDDQFYPYIEVLYSIGAVSGYSDGTYRSGEAATRAQAAKIIVLGLDDYEEYNDGQCAFNDVCPGHPFYHYIRHFRELGITDGYSDGTYRPDEDLLRGHLAKFVITARGDSPYYTDGRQNFSDVPPSTDPNNLYHYIERLYQIGATSGYSDGTYRPNDPSTRGQITKVVVLALPGLEDLIPTFYDVLHDNVFFEYVQAIAERGITVGCTAPYPKFCVDDNLTRGQASAFIIRALGEEPDYTDGRQTFPDVPPSHTFYDYIERLYELDIASGFSDGSFRPDENITRGQISKIVIRGLGEETTYNDGVLVFPDVPLDNNFYHDIRRLKELGITSGFTDGTYKPDEPITRGQASKFMVLAYVYRAPIVEQETSDQINNNGQTAPVYAGRERYVVPAGDQDYIKLTVPARASLDGSNTYQLVADNTGVNADIRIDVYDEDCSTEQATAVGEGSEGGTSLTWTAPNPGTYCLRLTNNNGFAEEGVYTDFTAEETSSEPCQGDFDNDNDVDIADVQAVASRWNTESGDALYDATYDLDSDGDIDILDVQSVASHWDTTCTTVGLRSLVETEAVPEAVFLTIQPSNQVVEVGQTFTIDVAASGLENLGAFEFTLAYDATLVEFSQASLNDFINSTGRNFSPTGPNNENGSVSFGAFSLGATPDGPSGDGQLATLTFRVLAEGTSNLEFTAAQVTDVSGTAQDISNLTNGQVTTETIPEGLSLTIQPSNQVIEVGQTFTIDVAASGLENLGAFEFTLAYDATLVEFSEASLSDFLNSTGRNFSPTGPNNENGRVSFGAFSLGATPDGPSGDGPLATLTFRVLAEGTTSLEFTAAQVTDVPGTAQDIGNLTGGQVTTKEDTSPSNSLYLPLIIRSDTINPSPTSVPASSTPQPEDTETIVPPSSTPQPSDTPTSVPSTVTQVPTHTPTNTPTNTPTHTSTPTNTPVPTPDYTYTVNPTGYVCGDTNIIKAQFAPDDVDGDIEVRVKKCDDSNFILNGDAYIVVDNIPNYTYEVSPSGYLCGTTGPSPNIVEMRLAPDNSDNNIEVRIRKCAGGAFSQGGRIYLDVNGSEVWGPVFYSAGETTIEFDIDPFAAGIVGTNSYIARIYSDDQPSIPKHTGQINAWEEYGTYQWGPISYSAGVNTVTFDIDPVAIGFLGTHLYQVQVYPQGQDYPIMAGTITAWEDYNR